MIVIPADSTIREILDPVQPESFRPAYKAIFRALQRGKALEQLTFLDGYYLLSLDGTGTHSSHHIGAETSLEKINHETGLITYYQQMVGAAIVCPGQKVVVPLMPEMIIPQDGETKNDCERNATRRWLAKFRKDHPHLKVVIIEDGLSSNGPHIRDLKEHNCRFILGVKQGDHEFLYKHVFKELDNGSGSYFECVDPDNPRIRHTFRFINQVPLNKANQDLLVNFLAYREIGPEGIKEFHWVTDFHLTEDNVYKIMRGGRTRWKIENETFNTLKNQGYHLEHNFGQGVEHLSENFVHLMMLAFLVDQALQLACPLFQAVLQKIKRKMYLWEKQRSIFQEYLLDSMVTLYRALLYGYRRPRLIDLIDTS